MKPSFLVLMLAVCAFTPTAISGTPDCNSNNVPDSCDIDCGASGGPCDVPGCGQSSDCNENGAPDECDLDQFVWIQRSPLNAPGYIGHHALAYDSVRQETVLFGGYDGDPVDETWVWDGLTWTQRPVSGPGGRWHHAMAFDSNRGVLVLFGGHSGCCDDHGDTWEWGGANWSLRSTSGPSPRFQHMMAFDSLRGRTVLFGGAAGEQLNTFFGDTWEWDGSAWSLRSTTGPSPRSGSTLAFDSSRNVCVLFGGGADHAPALGDTWEWNGTSWELRMLAGPSPRGFFGMAFDGVRARTLLFGGHNGISYLGETWEWNGLAWTQLAIPGPSPRGNKAAFDMARKEMVLFGSIEGGYRLRDVGFAL